MTDVVLRDAVPGDAPELTAIAHAAKRHWGYPEEWIRLWGSSLTIMPAQVAAWYVPVARAGTRPVGFAALSTRGGLGELEHLWVLPEFMGRGIGGRLLARVRNRCAESACPVLRVVSDPHAAEFYEAQGGKRVAEEPSFPLPRVLPVLELSCPPQPGE